MVPRTICRWTVLFAGAFVPCGVMAQDDHSLRPIIPMIEGCPVPDVQDVDLPPSGRVTVSTKHGIEFEAKINGQGPFLFMLDTGASVNLISPTMARQLGLPLGQTSYDLAALGGSTTVQGAHIDRLDIGELALTDQTFYTVTFPWKDGDGPVAAIGYPLLQRLAVRVDFDEERLTLSDPLRFRYVGTGVEMPLTMEDQSFKVRAKVDGLDGRFVVDTGNWGSLSIEPGFAKEHELARRLGAGVSRQATVGAAGAGPNSALVRVKTLQIGEATVSDVATELYDAPAFDWSGGDGTIGLEVLKQFNLTFDCRHGALYLEKNRLWGNVVDANRAGIETDPSTGIWKISSVRADGPGARAGVRVGDVILRIDGRKPTEDLFDVDDPAFLQPVGSVVRLEIGRGKRRRRIKVTLGESFPPSR